MTTETREHATSTPDDPRWTAIVTTRQGRCYFAVYAGDRPEAEKVERDYLSDRKTSRATNWSPYRS